MTPKSHTPEYTAWLGARTRCYNPRHDSYPLYGGRGIRVADEWRGPGGFDRFFAEVGPRPTSRHSLDRIDPNGDYAPGNVRWATPQEQARNKRGVDLIVIDGEELTLEDAGKRLGISRQAVYSRIAHGWTREEAATIPKGQRPERLIKPAAPKVQRYRYVASGAYRCGKCGEAGHNARRCRASEAA